MRKQYSKRLSVLEQKLIKPFDLADTIFRFRKRMAEIMARDNVDQDTACCRALEDVKRVCTTDRSIYAEFSETEYNLLSSFYPEDWFL